MKKERKYLEHEKLAAVAQDSQKQGEFLEWLRSNDYYLCREQPYGGYWPTSRSIEQILAEYYGIDQRKLEKEKRAMLTNLRK